MLEKGFDIDNLGLFLKSESLSQLCITTFYCLGYHEIEIMIRQEHTLLAVIIPLETKGPH